MRGKTLGLSAAVAVMAAFPVAAGADAPRDKATGGGQVLLDPDSPPTTGALDTIAFTAQRERGATDQSGLADGQVQVNRRSGDALKFHGEVRCLIVVGSEDGGGKAYISGVQSNGDEEGTPFELYIVDGGDGDAERGGDQALVWYGAETEENEPDNQVIGTFTPPQEDEFCGIEEDPSSKREIPVLARGNYQVHDFTGASSARQARSSKSSASLTSLSSSLR